MGKAGLVVVIVLVLCSLGGLAMVAMENQALKDRIAALERQGSRPATPAAAAPTATPQATALPQNDTSHLEARLAELEKRAEGAISLPTPALKPVATTDPAGTATDGAAQETPPVNEEFRKAVLAVLKERDDKAKERDSERTKMWMEGMVDRQLGDLSEKLQLTDTQKEQIGGIFKEGMAKLAKVWAPMMSGAAAGDQKIDRTAMMAETTKITAEVDTQAKTYLTVDQSVKYDDWRKEQNNGMFGARLGGGGARGR